MDPFPAVIAICGSVSLDHELGSATSRTMKAVRVLRHELLHRRPHRTSARRPLKVGTRLPDSGDPLSNHTIDERKGGGDEDPESDILDYGQSAQGSPDQQDGGRLHEEKDDSQEKAVGEVGFPSALHAEP